MFKFCNDNPYKDIGKLFGGHNYDPCKKIEINVVEFGNEYVENHQQYNGTKLHTLRPKYSKLLKYISCSNVQQMPFGESISDNRAFS